MRKLASVLLVGVVAFGLTSAVLAGPAGGCGGQGCGKCDPAKCGGKCDPAKCGGKCDPAKCGGKCDPAKCGGKCDPAKCGGKCDPATCKGAGAGCAGQGKGHGAMGGGPHGMMLWADYAMVPDSHRARMLQRHPEVDTDADGVLSEAEFNAFRAKKLEGVRATLLEQQPEADTDKDGVLSDAEFQAYGAKQLEDFRAMILKGHPEADTNTDGALSVEETRAFLDKNPGGCCAGAGDAATPCGKHAGQGKGCCQGAKATTKS